MRALDVIILTGAAVSSENLVDRTEESNERTSTWIASQVLKGNCDPVDAEARLNALPNPYDRSEWTPAMLRGASALARLVGAGMIDPIFAENALDRDLYARSVAAALENGTANKQR